MEFSRIQWKPNHLKGDNLYLKNYLLFPGKNMHRRSKDSEEGNKNLTWNEEEEGKC